MKWAHYLLKEEFHNDPDKAKKNGAPAGFIFHFQETEVTDPAQLVAMSQNNVGQVQVDDGVLSFMHKIHIKDRIALAYSDAEKQKHFPEPIRYAQYKLNPGGNLPEGFIHALVSNEVTRPMDLARNEIQGIHQIAVPVHVDHYTHYIAHDKRAYVEYTDEEKKRHFPPPRPGMIELMFEAHLKEGKVSIDDLHDDDAKRLKESFGHHFGEPRAAKFSKTAKGGDKPAGR